MKLFKAILFSLTCFLPFLVFGSDSLSPTGEQCSSRWLNIDVNAQTAGFAAKRLCQPASWAIDQMDHCGFAIKEKLTVEVVEDLRHPFGIPVVGKSDSSEFSVQVASPSQCRQLAREEIALAEVEFHALYESIVVHEVIHAVLWQQRDHPKNESVSEIAGEYVAYALSLQPFPVKGLCRGIKFITGQRHGRRDTGRLADSPGEPIGHAVSAGLIDAIR